MAENMKPEENITSEDMSETSENITVEVTDSKDMSDSSENIAEDSAVKTQETPESREPKKIENLEKALRVFKRKSAGIISEVRKREAYDSPSVKRKKKSKEARRKKKMGYKFGNRYQ